MELSPGEMAWRALTLLASRLDGILEERLKPLLQGLEWTVLLAEMDRHKGRVPGQYSRTDVQAQLRLLTERVGQVGYPLDDHKRTVSTLGSELRIVRNHVAHGDEMDLIDAWRAADFVVRLLQHFGDAEGADAAVQLRDNTMRLAPETLVDAEHEDATVVVVEDSEVPGEASLADEEVLENPHEDSTGVLGRHRAGYEAWPIAVVGDVDTLNNLKRSKNSQAVRAVIQEIVEFEGPVHLERVAVLVGRAFGLGRVEEKRKKAIRHQAKNAPVGQDARGFLWPESLDPSAWREFRPHSEGAPRPFDEIPVEELANAARFLGKRHPDEDRGVLERMVMQTFGYRKRTVRVREQMALCWQMVDDRD
ncbi:DUF3320 domain-containing protein [Galactobacter valiniphilus]|uniref:DUF3320 domain-containing protein n=1 Tax=Galactobacter valiniphilus TaxID=2676122 RepID=UPI003734D6BE